MTQCHDFTREALVDFPDDALEAPEPISAAHIDAMMRRLAACGVRRVSWAVYGDGRGGFLTPGHDAKWQNLARTYQLLGQNPLAVAVQAAHRHGLAIYAYFKPYEMGPAALFPMGTYEATLYGRLDHLGGRLTWMDPFVANHPHLRIKRRDDDLPAGSAHAPIRNLKLRKRDATPTRVTREHLQLWACDLNDQYRRLDVPFTVTETIEPCPADVPNQFSSEPLVRAGDPQRVLTLSGFSLDIPYLLVTTDFTGGTPDFANAELDMLSAYDADGHDIPIEIATGGAVWFGDMVDFRHGGLMFDYGWARQPMLLDEDNTGGKKGFIALTRGRNAYLPGALCETEPAVQAFWLSCIDRALDAGVDGIDFREENHSTHTNHPTDYGFNNAVLAQCRERGQVDLPTIAAVRGDAYTAFLAQAKCRINQRGKAMRINFQLDWYRPDAPMHRELAYPMNIDFQWQRWIEEGLTDEAVLRFYTLSFDGIFTGAVAQEMIDRCRRRDIPVTVNRYLNPPTLIDEYRRVRDDGRFAGFILYETASFLRYLAGGECEVSVPEIATLAEMA